MMLIAEDDIKHVISILKERGVDHCLHCKDMLKRLELAYNFRTKRVDGLDEKSRKIVEDDD